MRRQRQSDKLATMSSTGRSRELDELIMQGRLDVVLQHVTVDEFATAWCRYSAQPSDEHAEEDPDWWAISFTISAALEHHPIVRPLLLALIDAAPDERVVGNIGAGPLEDFISDDEDDLAWLEAESPSRPKLAQAVAGAWVAGSVSASTLVRLDRIAGVPLVRPRPKDEWPRELVELDDATRDIAALLDPGTTLDASSGAAFDRYIASVNAVLPLASDDERQHDGD